MTNEPDSPGVGAEDSAHQGETLAPEKQKSADLKKEHPRCIEVEDPSGSAGGEASLDNKANSIESDQSQKAKAPAPATTTCAAPLVPVTSETFGSPLTDCDEGEGEHRPGYYSPIDKQALERSMSSVSKTATWGTPSTTGSPDGRSKGPVDAHGSGKVAPRKDDTFSFGLTSEAGGSASFSQALAPPPTPVTAPKSYTGGLYPLNPNYQNSFPSAHP